MQLRTTSAFSCDTGVLRTISRFSCDVTYLQPDGLSERSR
jgi:hypothetical protein